MWVEQVKKQDLSLSHQHHCVALEQVTSTAPAELLSGHKPDCGYTGLYYAPSTYV